MGKGQNSCYSCIVRACPTRGDGDDLIRGRIGRELSRQDALDKALFEIATLAIDDIAQGKPPLRTLSSLKVGKRG